MSYEYPDVREALFQLTNGRVVLGSDTLTAYYQLTPDAFQSLPVVTISVDGGSQGFERLVRANLDVYAAAGTAPGDIGNDLCSYLTNGGAPHWIEGLGLIDSVVASVIPHDVPYPDPTIGVNNAQYRITVRPA